MLVLSRRPGQRIMIGDDIVITLVECRTTGTVRIGIDAPREVPVVREELYEPAVEPVDADDAEYLNWWKR